MIRSPSAAVRRSIIETRSMVRGFEGLLFGARGLFSGSGWFMIECRVIQSLLWVLVVKVVLNRSCCWTVVELVN